MGNPLISLNDWTELILIVDKFLVEETAYENTKKYGSSRHASCQLFIENNRKLNSEKLCCESFSFRISMVKVINRSQLVHMT